MVMKLATLLILISFAILIYGDEEYCYAQDKNPYGFFGTKTPYDNVRPAEISSPADCLIVFIWALFSPGTRYVVESDHLSPKVLNDTRDEIVANHEKYGRGELCKEDLDLLKSWKFPWDEKAYGNLALQGNMDMENLAQRWKNKFPTIINSHEKFQFQSHSMQLSRDSAATFRHKLFGALPDIQVKDDLFKIGPFINASQNTELNKFTNTSIMDDILEEVSSRAGFNETLSFDAMNILYRQCALERANKPSAKSAFCSIFTPENLETLEYYDDLDTYYALGYGNDKNINRACPLARDLYQKMENVRKNENPSQHGVFYFGQNYNVLTLLTKLGLFFDPEALKHDNYEKVQESRQWRTSFIDSFAANVVAVMYNCSHELKVSFYVSESMVQYPGCTNGVCLWSSLKEKFNNEVLKECSGESRTTRPMFISIQITVGLSLVILNSLWNSWYKLL